MAVKYMGLGHENTGGIRFFYYVVLRLVDAPQESGSLTCESEDHNKN